MNDKILKLYSYVISFPCRKRVVQSLVKEDIIQTEIANDS